MASQLPRQDRSRAGLVGDVLGGADNHPTVEAGAWDARGVRLNLDVGLPGDPGVDAPRVLRRAVRLLEQQRPHRKLAVGRLGMAGERAQDGQPIPPEQVFRVQWWLFVCCA
jgi:hypothetical protein